MSHPRDPYHGIDDGAPLDRSESNTRARYWPRPARPGLRFEAAFPLVRYYLPPEDVRVELRPSELQTTCAYKGQETHYTATIGAEELVDIAWNYQSPLSDAADVAGLVCFYHERLDLVIDGKPVERLRTPWSGRVRVQSTEAVAVRFDRGSTSRWADASSKVAGCHTGSGKPVTENRDFRPSGCLRRRSSARGTASRDSRSVVLMWRRPHPKAQESRLD